MTILENECLDHWQFLAILEKGTIFQYGLTAFVNAAARELWLRLKSDIGAAIDIDIE